jgi:regulator of CtrA degradation
VAESSSPTEFFGKTYDETFELLLEARSYIRHGAGVDAGGLEQEDRLRFALECLRVTSRLSQVMAWLLNEKAIHAGEIGREELAGDEHRLSQRKICLDDGFELSIGLPPQLLELLARSRALYIRVSRLDELAHRAD